MTRQTETRIQNLIKEAMDLIAEHGETGAMTERAIDSLIAARHACKAVVLVA